MLPPSPPSSSTLALPEARRVTSPLWRIWLPLGLASVISGLLLAWWTSSERAPVAPMGLRFAEVGAEAGLVQETAPFAFGSQATPSTLGGGVVTFDYNGDGAPDLYVVSGGVWPWEEAGGRSRGLTGALFRNDGNGRFTDVTIEAGVTPTFVGVGVAAGDYDRDGWPDLAVTGVGALSLYRNQGDGTFRLVPFTAGLGQPGDITTWRSGATWLDVNRDGWLDLIVMTYARWAPEVGLEEALDVASGGRSYGTPTGFVGDLPECYLNRGDGTFVLAPDHGGLECLEAETRRPRLWGLSCVPLDANEDARPDLLLTFAEGPPLLFLSRAEGGFRRTTLGAEIRREGDAFPGATAGLESGRGGGDGRSQSLLRWAQAYADNPDGFAGQGHFGGLMAVDLNRDGRTEAVLLGSRLEPSPQVSVSMESLRGVPAFTQERDGAWAVLPARLGLEGQSLAPSLTRAAVAADFDGDGDDDLVVTRWGEPTWLLRNESRLVEPWLAVDLRPESGKPEPYGARVELVTPRGVQSAMYLPVHNGLGQIRGPLNFGLAADSRVRRLTVRWPDGTRTERREPAINRIHSIRPEGTN